jgi:serine/threonine-protein kinase PpkA
VISVNIPGYTIERRIGTGGQAMVYEAVQDSLRRRVALKVLNPVLSGNKEFTERFLNEGRILANLEHSNVITIHDIGVVDDLHYLSMELVLGGDLRVRMRQGLEPETAIDYVAIIADCLGVAHGKQVVHRDIKPGNVLFRHDDTLLLTDFGIAKLLDSNQDDSLTLTGTTLGSPSYLSPEQAQNLPLDGRADIYSLGALAFEMLSGRRAYCGDSEFATIHCHLTAPIPQLPEALAAYQPLIERMMAKSPDDRFANAAELIDALRAVRPEIPVRPRPEVVQEIFQIDSGEYTPLTLPPLDAESTLLEGGEAASTTTPSGHTVARRLRRGRGRGLAAAAGVVLGLASGWTYLGHLRSDRTPAADDALATATIHPMPATAPAVAGSATAVAHGAARDAETPPGGGSEAEATPDVEIQGEEATPAPPTPALPATTVAVVEEAPSVPVSAAPTVAEEAPAEPPPEAPSVPVSATPAVVEETPAEPPPVADAERVAVLLASAREAMDDLRLTRPEDRSALFYYDQVLVIEPDNREARDGHRVIAHRYAGLAESALARGDSDRANALIGRGLSVDGGNARLLALSEEVAIARTTRRRASVETAATGSGEIRGESPQQLYRRIKSWFN